MAKTTRYRIKQTHPDYYNRAYTLEKYVIKDGTNGHDGIVETTGRIKMKEEDILNLIQFALEQRILVEKKKERKQTYNYLKLNSEHQPNKKFIDADFIDPMTAYKGGLSKPALARYDNTGTADVVSTQGVSDVF